MEADKKKNDEPRISCYVTDKKHWEELVQSDSRIMQQYITIHLGILKME